MWFFEKEESRWRKNPLLRCWRVCNGHNSCPQRSPRSCSPDEFFFNCRSFLSCVTSFTWWSLCPGSWAQWDRSWSRTSSRPPAPGPALSATPFMQTLLIVCKPIRGREGKGSSLKKRDVRWVKVSQQTWIGIKLRLCSYHTKKARVDLIYTSSEWSEFLSLKRSQQSPWKWPVCLSVWAFQDSIESFGSATSPKLSFPTFFLWNKIV